MTDETSTKRKAKPTTPLDFDQPIALTLHQTPTQNVVKVFNGRNAAKDARAHASERTVALSRPVAVFDANDDVLEPPAQVTAVSRDLAWKK